MSWSTNNYTGPKSRFLTIEGFEYLKISKHETMTSLVFELDFLKAENTQKSLIVCSEYLGWETVQRSILSFLILRSIVDGILINEWQSIRGDDESEF